MKITTKTGWVDSKGTLHPTYEEARKASISIIISKIHDKNASYLGSYYSAVATVVNNWDKIVEEVNNL